MTDEFNGGFPLEVRIVVISMSQLSAVYALLGGAALAAGNAQRVQNYARSTQASADVSQDTGKSSATNETDSGENQGSVGTGETATTGASPSDDSDEIDAHGHRWSADLHASTKGKTKEGLWRMKPGASRPAPLPGYPVDTDTGTAAETPSTSATSPAAADQVAGPAVTEEDDEFAAFRNAAAASDATDAQAAASVPARTYSDADLGALCNQAAVKLGDPTPIKEIIASYIPEGQVAHSRNIPEDKRATFVGEVETKAGIEFAG